MDYKVDIRFLILSILFHIAVFSLLKVEFRRPVNLSPERVEITLKENPHDQKIVVPKLKEHPDSKDDNNQAHFMSDQVQHFKKESISQNLGVPKNQQAQQAQQKVKKIAEAQPQQKQETPQEHQPGPNFLALPQQQASLEARQSSINFELPNVSKGEFTFLNSDFSTYAAFYNRITPMIMYHWGNNIQDIALFPYMREKLLSRMSWTTRVELILDRQGHYLDTIVENSCGSPELDQAVVNGFKGAAPFLNPPSGMIEADGKVHIEGEFTVYTQRPRLAY